MTMMKIRMQEFFDSSVVENFEGEYKASGPTPGARAQFFFRPTAARLKPSPFKSKDMFAAKLGRRFTMKHGRRSSTSERLTTVLGLVLLGTMALSGCGKDEKTSASAPEAVRNVPIVAVQRTQVPDVLEAVGTVQAAQTSVLASQAMGNIVEIRVREGDRVQRGQVLAVIDEAQPRAALERARAADVAAQQEVAAAETDLTLANATYKRYQTLYDRKSVSPQEFDEIKAREQGARARREMAQAGQAQAQAAISQAQTSLDYTRIRAPFDGVVTEKKVDAGTLASPGMPVFTVEDVRRYRLEATINEGDLRIVKLGQSVPVLVDALESVGLKGKVVQIVPAVDPASRSFVVKLELPATEGLRSGLYGRAQFARGERQAVLIPRTAVLERGQLQGVFALDSNRVAGLRYVTLGEPSGDMVEVLAGLEGGEQLVMKPGDRDLNGKRIEAQ
jgi:RND family efflux transporter MFP subunit